ncbi:MAG: hypothetical protein JXB88_12310 [Spirochaetales bacterium]|nr:hypothetical protein [Spirochaetales bacterium]
MDKKEPLITTFHFKMDIQMMDELTDLSLFQKTQNLSETICRILMQLFPLIEKKDMEGVQHLSEYKLINEDTNVKRKHIIIHIPDFLYRRLKCLHDVLNYYSMAQLVRDLLLWFLDLVRRFGDGYGEELMKIINEWVKISSNTRFLTKYIHQLLAFKNKIMRIIRIFNIYTLHFTPYRVFRL